ncbi:MAG: hypothetical protein WCK90_04920 [archaeon]
MEEDERVHLIKVLEGVKIALIENDSAVLKDLSNQTIHSASMVQDEGSITLAVIVYALSKFIERNEHASIKNWQPFTKKFISYLNLSVNALNSKNFEAYIEHLERARKSIQSISSNLKPYIQEVMKKASINKASRIYEHGISLGRTAHLLGLSQWELTEYAGQAKDNETPHNKTVDVQRRAKMAMEFFS